VFVLCFSVFISIFNCSDQNEEPGKNEIDKTIVVNLTKDSYDMYIGRGIEYHTHMMAEGIEPGEEGWLGNPHPIGWCDRCKKYHTRDQCIEKFKEDFYIKIKSDPNFKMMVLSLKGKRLGCYCKPKTCHGDVIKEWIERD